MTNRISGGWRLSLDGNCIHFAQFFYSHKQIKVSFNFLSASGAGPFSRDLLLNYNIIGGNILVTFLIKKGI